jgi:anti-sigma factor RsiW
MNPHLSPDQATLDAISAYLDGRLNQQETAALEKALRQHPEWRETLDELAAIRSLLRSLPELHSPKNFILSQAASPRARTRDLPMRAYGFGSALAAIAAVVVFAIGVLQAPMAADSLPAMEMRAASVTDHTGAPGPVAVAPEAPSGAGAFSTTTQPAPSDDAQTKSLANTPPQPLSLAGAAKSTEPPNGTAAPKLSPDTSGACSDCLPPHTENGALTSPAPEGGTPPFTLLLPVAENQTSEPPVETTPSPLSVSPSLFVTVLLMFIAVALGALFLRSRKRK